MAYDEDLAMRIRAAIGGLSATSPVASPAPAVREQRMFGGLAFLIGGHMAVVASRGGGIMLHVDPAAEPALLDRPHVSRMIMRGRELAGWLRVDTDALDAAAPDGEADIDEWVRLGVDFARSRPPK